ncbi:acyltransferase family protein [Jeotgalibaca sp. A127]|uniref:acyltransferase family protein n=1 Tax=Jeotgalibaca sp. A127 TaxID=3457324 RepID=UPI003FD34646
MSKSRKIKFVSLLKVFGVLIVILGHSMILYQTNWNVFIPKVPSETINMAKNYINIFQMPLFVMISGYLFFNSHSRGKYLSIILLIKDKAIRLLVPYFFVTLSWVIPIRLFVGYKNYKGSLLIAIKNLLTSIDVGHTWFLVMLFLVFIIFFSVINLGKGTIFNLIIFTSFYMFSILFPSIFQIKSSFFYLIFFYLGYLFNEYKEHLNRMLSHKVIAFLFSVNFITWVAYYLLSTNTTYTVIIIKHILFLISSCSAIIVLYGLFSKGTFDFYFDKIITKEIDKNNFGLYLFHEPIIYLIYFYLANTLINPWLMVVICFTLSTTGSLVITNLLRKINLGLIIGELNQTAK